MSPATDTPPPASPSSAPTNRLGFTQKEYDGAVSTLCKGCGHDSITNRLIQACWEMGVEPHRVAKMSGIGCSSKTPAYFLGRSHGINAVHGRMPSIATGTMVANRTLLSIGVSGDGDTASIGMGQFCHLIRRNVPMLYIIENNGVYGLTKGQFSATADVGSVQKGGTVNEYYPIDCCALAINLGCGFVARSFSGDAKQLLQVLKAALAYKGTALVDVISPCVTFNDHEGSTKSYKHAKETDTPLHEIGFVPYFDEIKVDYEPGTTKEVTMHDGSKLLLKKLQDNYDPGNKIQALTVIDEAQKKNQLVTGILYVDPRLKDYTQHLNLVDEPLATLPLEKVRPQKAVLDEIMESYK